ncbi:hypothetical protein E3P84_01379 [Wallemia ichthyophaga]|nr:hypothetical protein E3P84_01379 [Wallemia ichthyophaga]TIB42221.1 hypothetical protein E3P83_01328 [Wallemia ichthyophaga]
MFSNNNFNTHCSASYGSTAAVSGSTSERYNAGKEFSKDAANFVSSLFECPESKSIVSLGDFIHYALYRTRLHISVALSALILLQRLKARYPNAKGSSGHRLWLAAIMITNKMFNDDSFTNQSWYIASQQIFSQREVNAVERELFGYLSCDQFYIVIITAILILTMKFMDILSAIIPGVHKDIISELPLEISIYILVHINLEDILNCQLVCKSWNDVASDNLIYRDLFYRFGWELSDQVKDTPPPTPAYTPPTLSRSSSVGSLSRSSGLSRSNSVNRSAFASGINKNTQFTPLSITDSPAHTVHTPHTPHTPSTPLTPLSFKPTSLDWYELFKCRMQLERRWFGGADPKIDFLQGHTDSVYTVAFDDEKILSGSRDRSIRIWDMQTLRLLATYSDAHDGSVISLKFCKTFGVSAGSDGVVHVWKLGSGRTLGRAKVARTLSHHTAGVLDVDFNNHFIASCSKDSSICVYSRKSLTLLYQLDHAHSSPVNSLSITKSNVLASAGGDKAINVWNLDEDVDNEVIASGSSDNTIQLSLTDGTHLCNLVGHAGLVRSLQIDSARRIIVSGSYDRCVKVWNLNKVDGDIQYTNTVNHHSSLIFDLAFDSRRIVTASHDKRIMVVDFSAWMTKYELTKEEKETHRRQQHSELEKRRRLRVNMRFEELRQLVSNDTNNDKSKPSDFKLTVLDDTITHINNLKARISSLEKQVKTS